MTQITQIDNLRDLRHLWTADLQASRPLMDALIQPIDNLRNLRHLWTVGSSSVVSLD
jgi:hypothetical protein